MLMKYTVLAILSFPLVLNAETSTCYGTTSNGSLIGGVQLPSEGINYVGYSSIARLAGRTYVHSDVRDIVVAAYKQLEAEQPGKVYKYAESGFREGGQFKPHKTHRNGLSVDFMTPVVDENGESVCNPPQKLGHLKLEVFRDNQRKQEIISCVNPVTPKIRSSPS